MAGSSSDSSVSPYRGRKGYQVRAEATRALLRVFDGHSLDEALLSARPHFAEPRDQGLLQALCYGVLRDRLLLQNLVRRMLAKPLAEKDPVEALLLVGLYQLRSMRIPGHAAVAETVAATESLNLDRYRGLVNALLRRYLRERESLEAALPRNPGDRYSYPAWLVRRIREDWPDQWEAILQAGNTQAPMTLRVNARRNSREQYQQRLHHEAQLASHAVNEAPDALVLVTAVAVDHLPGFAAGDVSVQDAAAQLTVDLMTLTDGMRVLDACAAPGGKAAHMLERAEVSLLALDRDPARLPRVRETLSRLNLDASIVAADAGRPQAWWDGTPYDRILVDAPCSGTGVIRRHPDIKWLRRETDIERLSHEQVRLMRALWPLLAPGGMLLLTTCSILSEEGEAVARRFMMSQADAKHLPIEASWGQACKLGRRLAPGGHLDGFYFARFGKPDIKARLAAPESAA